MTLKLPLWYIKLTNYEYWPMWAFYIPILPYLLYLAIKARSLTFFTAVNAGMPLGGLLGEKKDDIFKMIPAAYLPRMLVVNNSENIKSIEEHLIQNQLQYPLIAKPNVGERGFRVHKLNNADELLIYHHTADSTYIIQEFIDYPIELGVFYIRNLNKTSGYVSSVTSKEFLSVTGNGKNTILQLLEQSNRGRFQLESMKTKLAESGHAIPAINEKLLLEPIGNHCRGTRFVNECHLINPGLNAVFSAISEQIKGFDYGRFDLKVRCIADLYEGKNIQILELNGVSSEPGHIYDQRVGLFKAYRSMFYHWHKVYLLSQENMKKGILKPAPLKEILNTWKNHLK